MHRCKDGLSDARTAQKQNASTTVIVAEAQQVNYRR